MILTVVKTSLTVEKMILTVRKKSLTVEKKALPWKKMGLTVEKKGSYRGKIRLTVEIYNLTMEAYHGKNNPYHEIIRRIVSLIVSPL